jgi:hypothetical protein
MPVEQTTSPSGTPDVSTPQAGTTETAGVTPPATPGAISTVPATAVSVSVEPVKHGLDAVVPCVDSVNEDLEKRLAAYLAGKDLSKVSANDVHHELGPSEAMPVEFERLFRSVVSKLTK